MDLLQIKKMENLIWTIEHSSDLSKRFYIIKFFDRENTIKPIDTTRENSKESLILQGIRTYTKFWSC
ncbi:hypothetical protein ABEY59_25415 [Bacillus albus]|uniref:hypothetical protein n=1 Tax=Bacillus albus TaxID=2026189 RepID=UPI003D20DCD6